MPRMGVDPMLKGVHRRNPWESESDDLLEMCLAGAVGLRLGIEFLEKFVSEKFHAHRSDFAEFNGGTAIMVEVFVPSGQSMEGVSRFVQDGFHVALNSDGVHEDKWQAGLGQGGLVTARGLALAIR